MKIKVIKRSDAVAPAAKAKPASAQKRHAAREVVSTVKNWVSDFQTRKSDEAKAAFERFLVKPQTTEV